MKYCNKPQTSMHFRNQLIEIYKWMWFFRFKHFYFSCCHKNIEILQFEEKFFFFETKKKSTYRFLRRLCRNKFSQNENTTLKWIVRIRLVEWGEASSLYYTHSLYFECDQIQQVQYLAQNHKSPIHSTFASNLFTSFCIIKCGRKNDMLIIYSECHNSNHIIVSLFLW